MYLSARACLYLSTMGIYNICKLKCVYTFALIVYAYFSYHGICITRLSVMWSICNQYRQIRGLVTATTLLRQYTVMYLSLIHIQMCIRDRLKSITAFFLSKKSFPNITSKFSPLTTKKVISNSVSLMHIFNCTCLVTLLLRTPVTPTTVMPTTGNDGICLFTSCNSVSYTHLDVYKRQY